MNTRLDVKQWTIASLGVFVVFSIMAFLVYKIELPMFQELVQKPEPTEDFMMLRVWNYLGRAFFSLIFVYIYSKGFEGKSGIAEGFRFGLWMGLLLNLSGFFSMLVTTNMPIGYLAFDKFAGVITAIIGGITVGAIYRPRKTTS